MRVRESSSRPQLLGLRAIALAAALALGACGGGGSADDSSNGGNAGGGNAGGGNAGGGNNGGGNAATTFSGVAAAGLPLVGSVTVKDAAGATRTAPIGSNGSYSIDVNGMTAPFVFRAEGRAGGREYTIHSAATSADVGGVINVTPLTDLAVSNIAGELARGYFDRGDFADLTPSQLAAEVQQLRTRLLPVLQELGVESGVDLLRTPFTPLSSALDKALDVLRVDYAAGVATITNVVTQQQIQDELAVAAADEASAAAMTDTTALAQSANDIDQIRAALAAFTQKFATGLPAVGTLRPSLSDDFLDRDQDADTFLADIGTFTPAIGGQFTEVTIRGIDYSNAQRPLADVSFVLKGAQGNHIGMAKTFKLVKDNGVWLLHGDQRPFDIEVFVTSAKLVTSRGVSAAAPTCYQSGLTLLFEDQDAGNSAAPAYVLVTGPGMPEGGARLNKPQLGGRYQIDPATSNGGGGNYYVVASSCSGAFDVPGVESIADNAVYTLTAYDASGNAIPGATYSELVPKRPLTTAETLAATQFPTITAPSFESFANYTGGPLDVSASGFDPQGYAFFHLSLSYESEPYSEVENELVPPASGTLTTSLELIQPSSDVTYRGLQVTGLTPDWREYVTFYRHFRQ